MNKFSVENENNEISFSGINTQPFQAFETVVHGENSIVVRENDARNLVNQEREEIVTFVNTGHRKRLRVFRSEKQPEENCQAFENPLEF